MVNFSLYKGVVEIQGFDRPAKDSSQYHEDPDGRPGNDGHVGVEVKVLQITSQYPSCLPLGDGTVGAPFSTEDPSSWDHLHS
jgi:hypothetical protein